MAILFCSPLWSPGSFLYRMDARFLKGSVQKEAERRFAEQRARERRRGGAPGGLGVSKNRNRLLKVPFGFPSQQKRHLRGAFHFEKPGVLACSCSAQVGERESGVSLIGEGSDSVGKGLDELDEAGGMLFFSSRNGDWRKVRQALRIGTRAPTASTTPTGPTSPGRRFRPGLPLIGFRAPLGFERKAEGHPKPLAGPTLKTHCAESSKQLRGWSGCSPPGSRPETHPCKLGISRRNVHGDLEDQRWHHHGDCAAARRR